MKRRSFLQIALAPLVASLVRLPAAKAQQSQDQQISEGPIKGSVPMAIGLNGINDWSAEQPFLDVMKTARPWIGHKSGQWGGAGHDDLAQAGYLDEFGWPLEIPPELSSIGTVVLTDLPEAAETLAGRYLLRFEGDGIVEVGGRARTVRYGRNEVRFDFAPGSGPVDIRIQRTDRGKTGNHVRNITIVREDQVPAFDAGAVFNPDFLDILQGFRAVRFMDWMQTNNSTQQGWDNRPLATDYTYALRGVPAEVMIDLANRIGVDAWFNMPHLADDGYVRAFATLVRDTLWHDLKAYMEFSNEVWNWQFEQAKWAREQGLARWDADNTWVQFYAYRAAQVAAICSEVYGTEDKDRLINVLSTQTGWIGLERDILDPPQLRREEADAPAPATRFDAYAITGYFGNPLGNEDRAPMIREWLADSLALAEQAAEAKGLTGAARDSYVQAHRFDVATAQAAAELRDGLGSGEAEGTLRWLIDTVFAHHAEAAATWGLDLIMYEGGTHVVGHGPMIDDAEITEFFIHLNYSPEMAALYTELIEGWHAAGGKLFNVFADVAPPSKWGSWGTLRHLGDDNPRWDAVRAFL